MYLVATFALLAVPALRAAPWLGVLCIMASWVTGWLVLAGGRTWTSIVLGSLVAWFSSTRVPAWTGRGLRRAGRLETAGMRTTARAVLVGTVTAALVLVFGALFAGADRAFASLVDALIPTVAVPDVPARAVTFVVGAAFAAGVGYLLRYPPHFDTVAPRPGRPVRRWEWVVPIAALDALFVAFVAVQLTVLFGGSRHVLETAGLTYAEYARQGFWQLLLVSALALVVLAFAVRTARYVSRDGPDSRAHSARNPVRDVGGGRGVCGAPDVDLRAGLRVHRVAGARHDCRVVARVELRPGRNCRSPAATPRGGCRRRCSLSA